MFADIYKCVIKSDTDCLRKLLRRVTQNTRLNIFFLLIIISMQQEELRNKLIEHTKMGTQKYISTQVDIDCATLSKFKTGKIDLYPELFERLHSFFEEK